MNAPAKPALAPQNTIATPVILSYPAAIISDTKIGMNGIVSSAIPNTEPQRENRNITIGIKSSVLLFIALIILPIPASIALVSCRTAIAPPTMKMKNIICADSCIPLGTAVRNCIRLTGVGSTAW